VRLRTTAATKPEPRSRKGLDLPTKSRGSAASGPERSLGKGVTGVRFTAAAPRYEAVRLAEGVQMNTLLMRFWSKVAVGRSRQCWPWRGARDRYGYGQFKPESGTPKRAHRVAYEITKGTLLHEEIHVLHTCDNPSCCNPAHLFEGDPKLNHDDREKKGRVARDENGQFLTTAQALEEARKRK
jgi:hypothetical protein